MTDSPEPLSAEELTDLRRSVAYLEERGQRWAGRGDVLRLLATLDAAPERYPAAPRPEGLDVERLRVATWRLTNAADALARYALHADDPGHRSWFPAAIGDVDREIRLARAAAGPAPSAAEYLRLSDTGERPTPDLSSAAGQPLNPDQAQPWPDHAAMSCDER